MRSSLSWNTITTGLRTGLSLLRYLVIARALSPRAFGLFALAKGLVGSFRLLKRLGSNGSLITSDASDAQRGSLYVLDLLLGVLLYCLLFQTAPRLALWFAEPDLVSWLRLLGFSLPLLSLTDQFYLLFQKEMSWRFLGLLRVAAFASGILTLFYSRSLIWETLVQYGVSVLVVGVVGVRRFPMPLHFFGPDLRVSIAFGLNEISRSVISELAGRISHLLLSRTFGPAVLGLLSMAQKLASQGTRRLSPILLTLLLPAFAALTTPRRKRRLLFRSLAVLFLVNGLLSLFIILIAPWLLTLLFGAAWRPAIPLAQILSLSAVFLAMLPALEKFFLSEHRLRLVFGLHLLSSGVSVVSVGLACWVRSVIMLAWLQVAAAGLLWLLYVIGVDPSQFRQLHLRQILTAGQRAGRRQCKAGVAMLRRTRQRFQQMLHGLRNPSGQQEG
jgi:O-antigen/teichoic acid export membrane protein